MCENAYPVADLSDSAAYKLIVGAVQPRPIAWVSSISPSGVRNLAPFSFFNVASRKPLTIMLSIGPPEDDGKDEKDTLSNIRSTGEFVVNVVSEDFAPDMVVTSAVLPAATDEFSVAGLTAIPSAIVVPPRVAGVPMALECVLHSIHSVGTDYVVFGRVVMVHAQADIVNDRFHVDTSRMRPIGRLAGPMYCTDLVPRRANELGDASMTGAMP